MNKNYYMVALDKDIKVISLNNQVLKEEDNSKLTKLPFIDYVTSRYPESTIRDYLKDKGTITYNSTPIYVVKRFNYQGNTYVKMHHPIYKDKYTYLDTNLALTELRNRIITLLDCGYLLRKLENNYPNNEHFKDILEEVLNEHDIKHLVNYRTRMKINNYQGDCQRYNLLRDIVSAFQLTAKYKDIYEYLAHNYGMYDLSQDIISVINDFEKNLPDDYIIDSKNKNKNYNPLLSEEELRKSNWDNPQTQINMNNNHFYEEDMGTLTLEDRFRSGFISYLEYCQLRDKTLKRTKKTSKKA